MKGYSNRTAAINRRAQVRRAEEAHLQKKGGAGTGSSTLTIGDPNSHEEKEADAIAGSVVNGGAAAGAASGAGPKKVQAKTEEQGTLMAKSDDGGLQGTEHLQNSLDSSKGGGEALKEETRNEMEPKMGADLSAVKIHTGDKAHKMAEGINAKAFTHGQDVYFKNGHYDTDSKQGRELLAHELAHTQQQKENKVQPKIQRKKDVELGGSEYALKIELFKTKTAIGSFSGEIKFAVEGKGLAGMLGAEENKEEKGKKEGKEKEEEKKAIELFATSVDQTSAKGELSNSISTALAKYEAGKKPLFGENSGISISLGFSALEAEMEKEEVDFSFLKIEGEISGGVEKPEQLEGTPWNTAAARELLKAGFKLVVSGSISYSIDDIRELKKLRELKRYKKQLAKLTEKIGEKADELNKLRSKQRAALAEHLERFRQERGLKDLPFEKFSAKQKEKFAKFLQKSESYKAVKKEVVAAKKALQGLARDAKPLMAKMAKVASEMKTPLGKFAAKIGLKAAGKIVGKVLARLNLVADIYFLVSDIVTFVRFSDHLLVGAGETPNPWDDVPEEKTEQGGDEGKSGKGVSGETSVPGGTEAGTSATGTPDGAGDGLDGLMQEEGLAEMQEMKAEEERQKNEAQKSKDGKGPKGEGQNGTTGDTATEDKQQGKEGSGKGKSADATKESLPQQKTDELLQRADDGQKAIFERLTDAASGIVLSEDFVKDFLNLPLSGLKGEQLKKYLDRMAPGDLKTKEEVLEALKKLVDELDTEDIEAGQAAQKKKEEESKAKKTKETSSGGESYKKSPNTVTDKADGMGGDPDRKDKKEEQSDFSGSAVPITTMPATEDSKGIATSFILTRKNVRAGDTEIPAIVKGTILETGETFKVTGLEVDIVSVKDGLIRYRMHENYKLKINLTGKTIYYTKGAEGSTKR